MPLPIPGMPVYHSVLPTMTPILGVVIVGVIVVGLVGLVIGRRTHHG
jgi:hypothetical protein